LIAFFYFLAIIVFDKNLDRQKNKNADPEKIKNLDRIFDNFIKEKI
jgi:hypothetical protein